MSQTPITPELESGPAKEVADQLAAQDVPSLAQVMPTLAQDMPTLAQIMRHEPPDADAGQAADSVAAAMEAHQTRPAESPATLPAPDQSASIPPRAAVVSPVPRPRAFGPLLLAGVTGGIIGAAAATLLYWMLPAAPVPDPAVAASLAVLERKIAAAAPLDTIGALDKRLTATVAALVANLARDLEETRAAAQKTAASDRSDTQAARQLAEQALARTQALDAALTAAKTELLGEIRRKPPESPPAGDAAANAAAPAAADLAPLESRLAALETALATAKAEAAKAALPEPETAKTGARVAVEQQTAGTANAAALVVVAQSLVQNLARPAGFGDELAAAAALGADARDVATLQVFADKGLPAPGALMTDFAAGLQSAQTPPPAPAADPKPAQGWFSQLIAVSPQLVRITPPQSPADAATAQLTQGISGALAKGDAAAALGLWQKLPERSRQATAAWAETATTRLAAEAAARSILASAIASLRKPKS